MTSTIRIQVAQAKVGEVRVFANGARRRITNIETGILGKTALLYEDEGGLTLHDATKVIQVELEETHPIAVLERMIARVEEQRRANHAQLLEAYRTGDHEAASRRLADGKLLQGKAWGLQYGVNELRAGIESI